MRYMALIVTVQPPDPAVLPAEAAAYKELTEAGKIVAGYLAETRTQAWLVVNSDTPEEARQIVESLPLSRYWQFEIIPLLSE